MLMAFKTCLLRRPCLVHEHVICHAILGRQGGKEMIIYVDLTVEFISPLLELSAKSVFFIVEKVAFGVCVFIMFKEIIPHECCI